MPASIARTINTTFEDFDPNNLDSGVPLWAVYDGWKLKTFNSRGPALNAVMSRGRSKLYEHVAGRWELRAVKSSELHGTLCDNCGTDVMVYRQRYDALKNNYINDPTYPKYNSGTWEWARRSGAIVSPPRLVFCCKDCVPHVRHG